MKTLLRYLISALVAVVLPTAAFAVQADADTTGSAVSKATISKSTLADRIVAWANDDAVTLSELEDALVRYQANGDLPNGPVNEKSLRAALDLWIDDLLIYNAASKAGVDAPAETIGNRVDAMMKQLEEQKGGPEILDALLESAGQDRESFRNKLHDQVAREWIIARAVNSRFVITDAEVAKFEKEREAQKLPTETYNLSHIFLPVSAEALQERWDKAIALAHEARMEAEKRGDFREVAAEWTRSHSADGVEAGSLGAMTRSEMLPELAEAVAKLKPGEIAPPVRTPKGIEVLYLDRKTTSRQLLFAHRFEAEKAKWVKELRNGALIQINEPLMGKGR